MKFGYALLTSAIAAMVVGAPGLSLAQGAGDLRKMDDLDVVTAGGEEIGEIEEVLMDASGQPVAVAVEVDDFLDIDDEDRIFRLDQLRFENGRFVTDLSESQIGSLPIWDD